MEERPQCREDDYHGNSKRLYTPVIGLLVYLDQTVYKGGKEKHPFYEGRYHEGTDRSNENYLGVAVSVGRHTTRMRDYLHL